MENLDYVTFTIIKHVDGKFYALMKERIFYNYIWMYILDEYGEYSLYHESVKWKYKAIGRIKICEDSTMIPPLLSQLNKKPSKPKLLINAFNKILKK